MGSDNSGLISLLDFALRLCRNYQFSVEASDFEENFCHCEFFHHLFNVLHGEKTKQSLEAHAVIATKRSFGSNPLNTEDVIIVR